MLTSMKLLGVALVGLCVMRAHVLVADLHRGGRFIRAMAAARRRGWGRERKKGPPPPQGPRARSLCLSKREKML